MRGEEEGVLVGVVEGVAGAVELDLMGEERMAKVAAGRPVRSREVVFMLAGRSAGDCWGSSVVVRIVYWISG
jgi:hypothetical protein